MGFESLEARVTGTVFGAMANASAFAGPSDSFPVVFDEAGGLVDEQGIVTLAPSFKMQPSAHVVTTGQTLTIRGVDYVVRSVQRLDEGNWQRVDLARS